MAHLAPLGCILGFPQPSPNGCHMPHCQTADPNAPFTRLGCEHCVCDLCGPGCQLCDDYVKVAVRKYAKDINQRRAAGGKVDEVALAADAEEAPEHLGDFETAEANAEEDLAVFDRAAADNTGNPEAVLLSAIDRYAIDF